MMLRYVCVYWLLYTYYLQVQYGCTPYTENPSITTYTLDPSTKSTDILDLSSWLPKSYHIHTWRKCWPRSNAAFPLTWQVKLSFRLDQRFPIDDMADSPWALAHHALVQCLVLLLAQCLRLNAAFCWIFFHWGFSFAFARLLKIHRNVKKWNVSQEMKWNVFHISSYLFSMGAWKETQSRLRHCLIDACKFSTFTVQCCMSTESTLHSLTD